MRLIGRRERIACVATVGYIKLPAGDAELLGRGTSCLKNRNKANQTTLERLLRQQGDQVPAIITWADMMACEAGLA